MLMQLTIQMKPFLWCFEHRFKGLLYCDASSINTRAQTKLPQRPFPVFTALPPARLLSHPVNYSYHWMVLKAMQKKCWIRSLLHVNRQKAIKKKALLPFNYCPWILTDYCQTTHCFELSVFQNNVDNVTFFGNVPILVIRKLGPFLFS